MKHHFSHTPLTVYLRSLKNTGMSSRRRSGGKTTMMNAINMGHISSLSIRRANLRGFEAPSSSHNLTQSVLSHLLLLRAVPLMWSSCGGPFIPPYYHVTGHLQNQGDYLHFLVRLSFNQKKKKKGKKGPTTTYKRKEILKVMRCRSDSNQMSRLYFYLLSCQRYIRNILASSVKAD